VAADRAVAERARIGLDVGAWLVAAAVLACGLYGTGFGYLNGDAAAYAAQGWDADLAQRTVHLGYVALATALAPFAGDALPAWLDGVTALAAAAAVLGAGAIAGRLDRPAWPAAGVMAIAVLPWASFGEVDLPWVALMVWAAAIRSSRWASALVALAVTLSPVALLAIFWVWAVRSHLYWFGTSKEKTAGFLDWDRGEWLIAGVAIAAVLVLTLVSGGDWWVGERGVLHAPSPRILRAVQAFAAEAVPWWGTPLLLWGWVAGGAPGLLMTVPLLLAPPDTHAGLLLAASLGPPASRGVTSLKGFRGWGRLAFAVVLALLCIDVGLAVREWRGRMEQVVLEEVAVHAVLVKMGPKDGLLAPWSWGARASVLATGDPYALPWRVPGEPVRDQVKWCNHTWERVFLLPPEAELSSDLAEVVRKEHGVRWVPGLAEPMQRLPGCRPSVRPREMPPAEAPGG